MASFSPKVFQRYIWAWKVVGTSLLSPRAQETPPGALGFSSFWQVLPIVSHATFGCLWLLRVPETMVQDVNPCYPEDVELPRLILVEMEGGGLDPFSWAVVRSTHRSAWLTPPC